MLSGSDEETFINEQPMDIDDKMTVPLYKQDDLNTQ